MLKYLKVFFVLFIIVPKCSQSLDLNVDQNRIAENAEILRKLEWEIEQEEKQMNIEKTKRDYKDFISNLKNKLKDCEEQITKQSNSTLSNILREIQNIKSNAQNNESNLKIKDELIANLTAQLENQSTTLNNKINQLIDVEIVDLKKQIENKNIEINNLTSNNLSAEFKLKEYEHKIISLESNDSSYKSSIDKKNEEKSRLEACIKQNKLQKNQSEDLKISLQTNLTTCTDQFTRSQQEKTTLNSKLQEKENIIKEYGSQIKDLKSNISSCKSSIDKKNAEISSLEATIKQNNLQTNLSICFNQLTNSRQEKTSINTQLQEKIKIIIEKEIQLEKCQLDNSNSEILKRTNDDLQNLEGLCKFDLKELQTKIAQKDVNIELLGQIAEDTQKKLDKCGNDITLYERKIQEKDIAIQDSDNKWRITQRSLSDCQKNLKDANQDILDAKSKTCIANQDHINRIDKELKESWDKESSRQKSLPNTCPSSTVGPQEIKLDNYEPFEVPCENGWIVIQQRSFGYVNFNQNFDAYKAGFGDWESDFFLGLEKLHLITNSQHYELRIGFVDTWNREITAEYDNFKIGNNQTDYKLESLGNVKGDLDDAMRSSENMKFSTFDRNFDPNNNCAKNLLGGWWFPAYCGHSNLNAQYKSKIRWYYLKGYQLQLNYIYMLIRPST